MQTLIGSAKTMTGMVPRLIAGCTEPAFQRNADFLAIGMARFSIAELQHMLHCSQSTARDAWFRYRRFLDPATRRPAIFTYAGTVFRKIDASTMSEQTLDYANSHLLIGSYIYGLLRPLDLVNQYRLEGNVKIPLLKGLTISDYWKPILTDWLIKKVKDDDGILVNLASREFTSLFDWKRIESELNVITPDFLVEKDGKTKAVAVYSKMCRGEMVRWIMQKQLTDTVSLKGFEFDGFRYNPDSMKFILHLS